jgi:hypothetical protein
VRPLSKYCHVVLRKGPIDIGRTLPTRLHTSPLREVPPPELAAELEQLGSGAVGARAPRPPAARRFKMKTSGRPRAEPQSTSPLKPTTILSSITDTSFRKEELAKNAF